MKRQKMRNLGVLYIFLFSFLLLGLWPGVTIIADTAKADEKTVSGSTIQEQKPVVKPTVPPAKTVTPSPTPAPVKKKKVTWKVTKKKCSHPKNITCGCGFSVKGTLVFSRKMKYVEAGIEDEEGKYLYHSKVKVNKKKFSLSTVDDDLKFSKLKKGTYHYVVKAVDTKKQSKEIVNDEFTVKKAKWSTPVNGGRWGDGWHCHCSTHHGKHYGWDIKGAGKPIHAVSDGTVVYAKYHKGNGLGSFGKLVIIYHGNGIYSYYAHCSTLKVKAGKKVEQGDVIAKIGATGMAYGPHLHFELRKGPAFDGVYNYYKMVDKYTYKQFNPAKKIKR